NSRCYCYLSSPLRLLLAAPPAVFVRLTAPCFILSLPISLTTPKNSRAIPSTTGTRSPSTLPAWIIRRLPKANIARLANNLAPDAPAAPWPLSTSRSSTPSMRSSVNTGATPEFSLPLTHFQPPPQWDRRRTIRSFLFSHHRDRKSTRLNSSHDQISYAVFCLKKKKK